MIGKNLLTVLIAVVVLSAAFFGYQHFTKSKDLEAHHEKSNLGLIEAAKKSPRAGLAQMGRAINKYYAENKSYPTNLDTLYPKYMNSKSFINDINWNYRPTGNNFLLSKNTILQNRTVVASTDKGLRVRVGASTTVALVDRKSTGAPATTTPDRTVELKTGTALEAPAEGISATIEAPDEKIQEPEDIALSKSQIQTVVIDESETPSGFVSELSNAYLVWKDEQGYLGFGNVQYPRIDGLSIATPYNWFNVNRPFEEEAFDTQEVMASEDEIDIEAVASYFSQQYLVWKDKNGNIGFGNVQYPRIEGLSIATPYNWFDVKRRSEGEASSAQEIMASEDEIDIEAVASNFSEQYLVWKDKNGNIGFGNTQYPVTEDIEYVNIDGEWFKFKR